MKVTNKLEPTLLPKLQNQEVYGVVGGMGPLASAEFVNRVYRYFRYEQNEQGAPFIIQYSDPTFPDRSTVFLNGGKQVLMERLVKALDCLRYAGATKYIICCFTIHHIIQFLPEFYKKRLISLVTTIIDQLDSSGYNFLFLSTTGTRRMEILESHPEWHKIRHNVSFLDEDDQELFHGLIYDYLKKGKSPELLEENIYYLLEKYKVQGMIAGCTELHLFTKNEGMKMAMLRPYTIVDPLDIVARKISSHKNITLESH